MTDLLHPTDADVTTGWDLADTALLRLNPTPGRRLGGPTLRIALQALYLAGREQHQWREPACAELYELTAAATGARRHRLLQLKRAVHNGRDPQPEQLAALWPEAAPPPAVAAWWRATERSLLARNTLKAAYDTLLAEERRALADAIGGEPFQLSLALNSPQVLDAVQRYRRAPGEPSARDRKSERGILQHYARAVLRVSPLSRLTAVGFARWSPEGEPMDRARFDRQRTRSVLTPDRALLSSLVTGIVSAPGADGVPAVVQRNPTLRVDKHVRFHHWAAGRRRALAAALTDQVAALLRLTQLGPVPSGTLATELAARLRVPVSEAARLVAAAVEAQILVAAPVLDEQAVDPVPAALGLLLDRDPTAAEEVAALGEALKLARRGSVGERIAALSRIRAVEGRLNERSAFPARLHVNEDYLLPPGTVSPAGYESALADLRTVTGFHAMFDRHHEIRALLVRAFVDRFGAGARVNLVDHAEELVELVRRREGVLGAAGASGGDRSAAERFGPADGSLVALLDQRAAALRQVTAAIEAAGDAPEVVLAPRWLAGLADGLPERYRPAAASYSMIVQPHRGLLVVNACYTGHGQVVSRFLGLQEEMGSDATQRLRDRIRQRYARPGVAVREDRGLHRSNINHRVRVLDDTLDPAAWLGLRLAHDPATDQLSVLDPDGVTVLVMGLGMKWIELQPAPLTLAVWLHDTGRVAVDPVAVRHAEAVRGRDGDPAGQPTVAYPRLRAGDVVLQRRRWYPGADLPATADPTDPAGHLVALTAWRAAHGVPDEVVLKTPLWTGSAAVPDDADAPGGATARLSRYLTARRREKPQYVDLASALMVRVLPQSLERRLPGYLEEALPGVRSGARATEWTLELDLAHEVDR
ncbi:lantibiotic dehydratase [Micromonospora mangrovi]|uniref:Lantibiotic dehydratase n=2 Tax=Micromonospora TaxID=1873 RepID=A0AAU8HIW7_9ACTN